MKKLLTILFCFASVISHEYCFAQNLNVKVFSTHSGNGNTSQYGTYANSVSDMDKMTNTAYSNTRLNWSGQMAITTCLNWTYWQLMSSAGASIPNNGEFFSVEVTGTFTPVETGTYIFGINSDDGSDLLLNGTLVTSYYGGHGMGGPVYGSISLVAGTAYTFKARMQEYGGGEGLTLIWKRPSQGSYSLQPAELGVYTPIYLTGNVSVPTLTSYPTLSLYKVVSGVDNLVSTITIPASGNYSFTLPSQNTTYKLVPSLSVQGLTIEDFNLAFSESQNINTPNNLQSGLVMTGTKQWKAADVNKNGKLDLGDAYLIAAHITNFRPLTEVLWFTATNYDLITKNNFGTITPVTSFTFNVTTSSVSQNIKYCILGDVNLSHSSQ